MNFPIFGSTDNVLENAQYLSSLERQNGFIPNTSANAPLLTSFLRTASLLLNELAQYCVSEDSLGPKTSALNIKFRLGQQNIISGTFALDAQSGSYKAELNLDVTKAYLIYTTVNGDFDTYMTESFGVAQAHSLEDETIVFFHNCCFGEVNNVGAYSHLFEDGELKISFLPSGPCVAILSSATYSDVSGLTIYARPLN